jgi:MHS family citrate/tricarballylate:H+ symporter-like MFS transporter
VSTWLINTTGDKASPGFWLMAAGLCGIVSTLALYRGGAAMQVRVATSSA